MATKRRTPTMTVGQKRAADAARDKAKVQSERQKQNFDLDFRQAEFMRQAQAQEERKEQQAKQAAQREAELEQRKAEQNARGEQVARDNARQDKRDKQRDIQSIGNAAQSLSPSPPKVSLPKNVSLGMAFGLLILFFFLAINKAPGQSVSRLTVIGKAFIGKATIKG